jgi:gliding motility-associated-like protein
MVCLSVFGLTVNQADAQQTRREAPPTFSVKEAQALPAQAYVKMPINFSVSEWLKEDEFNANNGISRPRFARDIPADITMENAGVWTNLPDGRKVWRVAIEASNAKAITLRYEEFYLPLGSKLFLYSADKTHILKSYDNTKNPSSGRYITPLVAGDVVVLEYVAPEYSTGDKARIHINGVGYGYNHIRYERKGDLTTESAGESAQCQINVICSPEGDEWQEDSKSVCAIYYYTNFAYELCSGTLVNNTANDEKPYIMSAWHCIADDLSAPQYFDYYWFRFFFESKTCVGNTGYDDDDEVLVGCKVRVAIPLGGGSDGALLELNEAIPQQWIDNERIRWAGWDRRADPSVMAQSGVDISHPALDVKKIATWTGPLTIDGGWDWGEPLLSADDAHWVVTFVQTTNGWGQSEGGSSGSGLLNQDHRLIGTLSGGPPGTTCTSAKETSYFGGLFYHWDQYGNDPSTQMKTWLDPLGNGTAETCDFYPNSTKADFVGNPTSIYALESVNFTSLLLYIDSIKWEFEGGTPATSTELKPVVAYDIPGTYDVKLTAYGKSDVTGNDTTIITLKEDYITVTVKGGTAVAPVADLGVLLYTELPPVYSDNAVTALLNGSTFANPPTITTNTSSTYRREVISGNANYAWIRANNGYANNGYPTSYGVDGTGDYYYIYYQSGYLNSARIYNNTAFDLSSYESAILKFKYIARQWSTGFPNDVDGLTVYYRTSPTSPWTSIYSRLPNDGANHTYPNWIDIEVVLPNLSSTYQIAFMGTSYDSRGSGIDNIEIVPSTATAESHVIIWEGDAVDFHDLSTGPAVLYKYEFEGGTPAESTDTADIVTVEYYTEGVYDVKQWVRNTIGEDEKTLTDYVTVLGHVFDIDRDTITTECGDSINETIELSVNRGWLVSSKPSWITVSPDAGTVSNPGTAETATITITAPVNYGAEREGNIVFVTDNNFATQTLYVNQTIGVPQDVKATRYNDVNIRVRWAGEPDDWTSLNASYGGFETANPVEWKILTVKEGFGWERFLLTSASGAHTGDYFARSMSYDYNTYTSLDVDNWLVTPQLEITSANSTLTYWISSQNPSFPDAYELLLSTDDNITSRSQFNVVLKSMANAPTGPVSNNYYVQVSIDLSSYTGQKVYLAFHHVSYDKFILKLDDIGGLQLASKGKSGLKASEPVMLSLDKAVFTTIIDPATGEQNKLQVKDLDNSVFASKQTKVYANETQTASNSSSIFKQAKSSTNLIKKPHTVKQHNQTEAATGINPLMRWCGEYDDNGVGAGGTPFIVAARWTAEEAEVYAGITIKAIEIAIYGSSVNIDDLFVWEIDGTDTTVLNSQSVSSSNILGNSKNVIPLETPVTISGDKQVMIGYSIKTYSGYPFGVDAGPEIAGKGNLVLYGGEWYELTELGTGLFFNWYIVAYEDFTLDGYRLYRQRTLDGAPTEDPVMLVEGFSGLSYNDEDIQPGGVYCYWLTYQANGIVSCSSDTACEFVLYRQEIQVDDPIETQYGHQFKLDNAGTGTEGVVIKSTADDFDYFADRIVPVKVEHISGNSISLSGNESDYLVSAEPRLGENILKASQAGIPDTLLAAEDVEFKILVGKGDILVKAGTYNREEGKENDPAIFQLDYQSFFYSDNVDSLDVTPTATCVATPLSPVGEYAIVVHVGLDNHYNVIPVNGILKVTKSTVVPNAFTPDEDGYNDAFMPGTRLKIFNRYGVLVYESKNKAEIDRGWNGRFQDNEKLVNPGVYYYILYDDKGKAVRKGSVNVVKK